MLSAIVTSALALLGAATAAPVPGKQPAGLVKRTGPTTSAPWFFYYSDKGTGIPDPSTLTGWNVFGLSFWLTEGPWDMVYTWSTMTPEDRNSTIDAFHSAGISLVVAAFGSSDVPTTSGADPTTTAQDLAAFVTQYGLDGVDVDYEDFGAMNGGTAVAWLTTFTTALRAALPDGAIMSHAPVAPWFTSNTTTYPNGDYLDLHKAVGDKIDFYNLQFYNQYSGYTDCASLVNQSTADADLANYEQTSLLEMMANGVPAEKLVLGKPGSTGDQNNGGYMDPATLATCVQQAKSGGWDGGLMIWEYPDAPADYVSTVWGSS